jgi:hypothetical protein
MPDPRDADPERLASAEPSEPARQNVVAGQPTTEPAAELRPRDCGLYPWSGRAPRSPPDASSLNSGSVS